MDARLVATVIVGIVVVGLWTAIRTSGRTSTEAAGSPTAQVLAAMRREGVDLTKPTSVAFFLYFPEEADARRAAGELPPSGSSTPVAVERPEGPTMEWRVRFTAVMVPTEANLDAMAARLAPVANRHGGVYDGWEADAVR
jgi:hypothetical protein